MTDRTRHAGAGSGGLRLGSALAGLVLIAALAGCAGNQAGLREWSIQAREVVLPPAAIRSLALSPETTAAPRGSRADAVQALQEAAGAWLAVLAAVADDATPPDDSAALAARAARVEPFDAAGAAAETALSQGIAWIAGRGWSSASIAYVLRDGDPLFQPVMAALARQEAALAAEVPDVATPARAARRDVAQRIAATHAELTARGQRVQHGDTGRELRLEASELRRFGVATR
jgi:hypothetical protein